MTTTHHTEYPVWPECTQHTNPEESDAHEFDCASKGDCTALPLADWRILFRTEAQTWADSQHAQILCAGCTARAAAMEEWEEHHESGTGIQDWSGVICKVHPPTSYCLECSEDHGDWVGHIEEDEATR